MPARDLLESYLLIICVLVLGGACVAMEMFGNRVRQTPSISESLLSGSDSLLTIVDENGVVDSEGSPFRGVK